MPSGADKEQIGMSSLTLRQTDATKNTTVWDAMRVENQEVIVVAPSRYFKNIELVNAGPAVASHRDCHSHNFIPIEHTKL